MTSFSVPNTFTPLTTISSSQVNANFTAVATAFSNSLGIAGAETMTGALKGSNGAAAAPAFTFGSDTDTGIYRKAANSLGFAVAGAEHGYIDSSGNWVIPTGALTLSAGLLTLVNAGLHLLDTDASHDLIIAPGSNLSADRTLTITTGDADRTLTLNGDITPMGQGLHTIVIPASAMLRAITNGPSSAQLEMSTNDQNFKVLDFDDGTDEYAHFNITMPKSWDEGTITFQVTWTTSAIDTDGVAWGLQAVALSDNESIDASWGTAVVVTDDAQGAANEALVTAVSSAVTIAGTPAEGDIVFFRLFRDVSDANDDMTEDARLISVKIFFTISAATDA